MDKRIEELEMQQTQRGFNQGYLLAKHKPELFNEIATTLKKDAENYYSKGFLNGGKQYEIEKHKEMQKAQNKAKEPAKQKTPVKSAPKPPTKGR